MSEVKRLNKIVKERQDLVLEIYLEDVKKVAFG